MYNRAEAIDENFQKFVDKGLLPEPRSSIDLRHSELSGEELIDVFETQIMSRLLDLRARELKQTNHCYYTIGSSGHEGNAAVAKAFRFNDMAFLHYRSGAFYIQRSKQVDGTTPLYDMLLSFTASKDEPIAGGRHKVIGSKELFIPPQTSTIASHLPKAVGAALSIGRAFDMNIKGVMEKDNLVLCSFGDASANHSTALGAINTASWISYQNVKLPLVFVCEDNGLGISTRTPQGWIGQSFSTRPELAYVHCDGLNILDIYEKSKMAENYARKKKKPVFLHMSTVRLMGHAGSDVETNYHSLKFVEDTERQDPLLHTAQIAIENGLMSSKDILDLYKKTRERIKAVSNEAIKKEPLSNIKEVASTITACADKKESPKIPSQEKREEIFQKEWKKLKTPQHMAKLINWGLTDLMHQYPNTLVFGEDVAEKGGVYHVTDNLVKRFGPRRVFNSPLDEQSIIGTGIGLAHNNLLPIPEIQFLAYVHNAEDQVRGEAATLSLFSQGQYTNPMVLRIAGLAYQRGFGGHFHNDNSLAVFRDIPGLIIAVPSNGADAVKMLRRCVKEAYENGRVCIFIEPIARYMTRDLHEENDKGWTFEYPEPSEIAELGDFTEYGNSDKVIVTYGNGTYLSLQAQKVLKEKGHDISVIDLKWMAPLNKEKLFDNLKNKKDILFVEEWRVTGSFAEGVVSDIVQNLKPSRIKIHGADDCFIPLGPAATAGLPSKESILKSFLEMVGE
ncbi:MAG: MFS transporter [Bdellovibrionales bacterium]|nr:thiamine pyrophosphate-dependent enzyme [Bdellovibrionales bacterium]NQZ18243.1 MFS transporter [Bdellovibrionales bacterium]